MIQLFFFLNIMANSLVETTFKCGPDDKLAAVDVYGEVGAPGATNHIQAFSIESSQLLSGGFGSTLENVAMKAISEARSMAANAIGGMQNALSQATKDVTALASKANSLISGTVEQIEVNKKELTDRILGASSEFSTAMRGLPQGINDKMLNSVPLSSDLMCTVDGVRSKINSTELKSVQAVGKLINDVTKTKIFSSQDTGALSGVLGSVIGAASELGIPNAFQAITSTITDNRLLTAVTRVAIPQVLSSGNMQTLRSISKTPAGRLVEAIAPGTVSQISKLYKAPTKLPRTARQDYSVEGVLDTINNLKPNWDVYNRSPTDTAVNIIDILGGSNDFKNLIKNGVNDLSPEKKIYQFASLVKQVSVGASLKKDFPAITVSSLQKTRKAVTNVMSPNLGR